MRGYGVYHPHLLLHAGSKHVLVCLHVISVQMSASDGAWIWVYLAQLLPRLNHHVRSLAQTTTSHGAWLTPHSALAGRRLVVVYQVSVLRYRQPLTVLEYEVYLPHLLLRQHVAVYLDVRSPALSA